MFNYFWIFLKKMVERVYFPFSFNPEKYIQFFWIFLKIQKSIYIFTDISKNTNKYMHFYRICQKIWKKICIFAGYFYKYSKNA